MLILACNGGEIVEKTEQIHFPSFLQRLFVNNTGKPITKLVLLNSETCEVTELYRGNANHYQSHILVSLIDVFGMDVSYALRYYCNIAAKGSGYFDWHNEKIIKSKTKEEQMLKYMSGEVNPTTSKEMILKISNILKKFPFLWSFL